MKSNFLEANQFPFLFGLGILFASNVQAQQKNVLFIAVDDLKPMIGCYGHPEIKTPNLDRLAEHGVIFRNNHCQEAVSAPTRASLITGRRPDYTKVYDLQTLIRDKNPEIVTLPQYFKSLGYQTGAVGKIFDRRSVDKGHDAVSWSVPYVEFKNQLAGKGGYIHEKRKVPTECADVPDSVTLDWHAMNIGRRLIDQMSANGKPFFVAVGFEKPHLPFVAPKKYWDLYNRDSIKLAPFREYPVGAPSYAPQPGWELRNYDDIPKDFDIPISDLQSKELIHGYYACVSYVDQQIGELLSYLDKKGLTENTVIVLWGDHGWHLGDHNMWCKHTNYEQATRSPLFFARGNDFKGAVDAPTEFLDVFPTVCELAGVPVPDYVEGKSLVPLMNGKKSEIKDFSVSQFPRNDTLMGYTFRGERYRYTVWLKDSFNARKQKFDNRLVDAEELYDYKVDSLEKANLINQSKYRCVRRKMAKQAVSYFKNQYKLSASTK